jgi:hypothetical protein
MRAKLMGVAVAATLAVLAAGCGGSGNGQMSKADYEAKIQADGQAVQDAVNQITSNPTSMAALAKQVDAAQVQAKKAADDLDATNPPTEVAADNDALVTALRSIDAELKKLAQAAKDQNPLAAQQAAAAIRSSPEVIAGKAAIKDMKKKGYAVGVLGSFS